jgi:hypothetical protein
MKCQKAPLYNCSPTHSAWSSLLLLLLLVVHIVGIDEKYVTTLTFIFFVAFRYEVICCNFRHEKMVVLEMRFKNVSALMPIIIGWYH